MIINHIFDESTFTFTYIISDPVRKDAVIIDPVLDFEPASGKISFESLDKLKAVIKKDDLNPRMVLETHAHADHLSSSHYLKKEYPNISVGIGEGILEVQKTFHKIFNLDSKYKTDGSQFDSLLKDNSVMKAGSLEFKVISTPGHTPACISLLFGENLFTGDALFMPDFGTGRCDFPKGSAENLFDSIHEKLYKLPDSTKVFVGHDYMPNGRELKCQSTLGAEKKENIHIKKDTKKADFISMREARDAKLTAPKLLLPSLQVNINAGKLPEAEDNNISYLKLPLIF